MAEQAGEVFIKEDNNLRPLPVQPLQGEMALQELIEEHPNVLPGKQMDPNSPDPPCFILLCREMPVGDWSLDHLLVDQRGVLTLVETKLARNPQARREVIGQIMEYAANAAEYWGSGRVRNETTKYWNKRRNDVNEVISAELGRDDVEDFWREVEEKLQRGQIRLIVAADELRPEVRRIIEYLNKEMKNAKIYGLELRHYKDESSTIIVPRLVGQTQAIADQKETSKPVKLWTADELRDAYDTLPDPNLGQRLRKVLDWAVNQGFFVQGRTQSPGFGLRGRSGSRIVSFFPEYVFCYLKDARYTGGAQERDRLVAELKTIGMYDPSFDPRFNETKNLARKLTDLSEGEFNTLLDIFTRFCAKAEGAA